MSSELSLYFAGIALSFFLQVAVAYIACSLLNRVLSRPGQRFAIWMAFLAASAAYWIALAGWNTRFFFLPHADHAPVGAANGSAIATPLVFPLAWSRRILTASEVLAASYVAIVLVLIMISLMRHVRLRLLLRHARQASSPLVELFETTSRGLGISQCDLSVMSGITSPATVGWLRPHVLLPAVCEEIGPTPKLADVLHHELAHVARRDYLWAGLSDLFCHLLFFHPAAWRAKRLMLFERELACDCAVVEAYPEHRADYADSLAYFVRLRMLEEKAGVGLDFAASASSLGRRVRFILAGPPRLSWWNRAWRAATGLAVMSAFAVVAPAITVLFAFAHPTPAALLSPVETAEASHADRKLHSIPARNTIPVQQISRIQAGSSVRGVSTYSLASGRVNGSLSSERDRPWRALDPSLNRPSFSDVLRDAVTILRPPLGDHDRDRDRNGRLTH
ncbi:MAG TPA: M56 family metallopeptidase [Terriglobales bacterium]